MRALVFDKELRYVKNYPVPEPGADEALIRVALAGICSTDIEITKGYMGFKGIPGHEFVGRVEKCSNKALTGKRVVGEINLGCGTCSYCRNHMQSHCPRRSVLGIVNKDGVFAEYVTLPVRNLHPIPDSISDEEAVFVEPLAAAFEITEQMSISSADKVCVLGDGKLGLLVAQVLSATGCNLITVGKHREKLSLLEQRGLRTRLRSLFEEKDFDIVVDCTGSLSGMKTALDIVRPRGTIVLKTTLAKKSQIDLNYLVINEIRVIGSRCGPFPKAIQAIKSGKIDLHPLISGVLSLKDGTRVFQHGTSRYALKVVLRIH